MGNVNQSQQHNLHHLAEAKHSKARKMYRIAISMFYIVGFLALVIGIAFAESVGGKGLATVMGFLGAATVFSLQNFVASFFTYIYLTVTGEYDKGDIVKIGDARISSMGEVLQIGVFATTIRELDEGLLFTGRQFTVPNQIFFSTGVFNYTRRNLLFWHHTKTLLAMKPGVSCESMMENFRIVVQQVQKDIVAKYPQRYEELYLHNTKYHYDITEKGIDVEVRISIHFYNVVELNNLLVCRLIDAHRAGKIRLVEQNGAYLHPGDGEEQANITTIDPDHDVLISEHPFTGT